jgi:hypothetical protein
MGRLTRACASVWGQRFEWEVEVSLTSVPFLLWLSLLPLLLFPASNTSPDLPMPPPFDVLWHGSDAWAALMCRQRDVEQQVQTPRKPAKPWIPVTVLTRVPNLDTAPVPVGPETQKPRVHLYPCYTLHVSLEVIEIMRFCGFMTY